ncbi:acyl-CoA thioesterase [filamentous cyanobacterium LEGE 11480]|uniref:Acyl-CoA thioesterase n=1 Tax=Romeriopsis navalis LEGE 11480 TaxID=2777977 RepID=A0A928VPH4_9CYAN|nr:acyl-CoA thioesterase [Romeriopsis navalis]MBE9029679.1 acyl-CoA thioesterase [Romeriopsis navalis LEGE 11480]
MSLTLPTVNTITFDLEAYSYQIDFSGFVSHIVYIQWIEIAWLKLLEGIALPRNQLASYDLLPVLTQTSIQYWRPLSLGDRVRVELWITRLEDANLDLKICFYNAEDGTVAEATQSWIFTDCNSHLPKALTPDLQSLFHPYLTVNQD